MIVAASHLSLVVTQVVTQNSVVDLGSQKEATSSLFLFIHAFTEKLVMHPYQQQILF